MVRKQQKDLPKENVITIIIRKYNALLVQCCESGIDKPVTKDFYNDYETNPLDKFAFNSSLLKDLYKPVKGPSEFEIWLLLQLKNELQYQNVPDVKEKVIETKENP